MPKPRVVLSNIHEHCLTFFWDHDPQYYVGYRPIEGEPQTLAAPLAGIADQPACTPDDPPDLSGQPAAQAALPNANWRTSYEEADPADAVQLAFQAYANSSAWCRSQENGGAQTRDLWLQPAEDGAWLWMRLSTRTPIRGAFCVQQCVRFTGQWNDAWRRDVARTPFLSELDVQAMGHPNLSLTYARRDGDWLNLPVVQASYPTPSGRMLFGDIRASEFAHGLVVRETLSRQTTPERYWAQVAPGVRWDSVAAGIYWERTAYVSNRHPADCLHAAVDFGPLQAGQSRTVRGKFYWIEGTKDDLLAAWRRDFAINNSDA